MGKRRKRKGARRVFFDALDQQISYRRVVQRDPCSYCPGPGGTADHIDPKSKFKAPPMSGRYEPLPAEYGDWTNLTGACERCNHAKDRTGKRAVSPLEMLLLNSGRES